MTDGIITKTCAKCKENLPTSGFSKDLREPSGISPICKRCRKSENLPGVGAKVCAICQSTVATEGFREDHTTWDGLASSCTGCERGLADEYPDTKTCTKCKENLPASWFSCDRTRRDGLASSCKSCHSSHYAANREKLKQRVNAWHEANPGARKAYNHRRRARKRNAEGTHSAAQAQARFAVHGNACIYCGSTDDLHVDHIKPLAQSGSNWPSNLAPACAKCNSSKGPKWGAEFIVWLKQNCTVARTNRILGRKASGT